MNIDPEMEALEHMTPTAPTTEEISEDVTPQPPMSLGKIDTRHSFNIDERLNQLKYIEVNRELMPYGSMFYPSGWVFKCRAAMGAEVANFSTIDNEEPMSVHEGINDLLKTCLRIENEDGATVSYRNLYEFDRLWFVLFIRDLTMQNTETKLVFDTNCEHCGEKNSVVLSYDTLVTLELSDLAKKYFSPDHNAFVVRTKSYGDLILQPSTIHRAEILKEWMQEELRKKNTIDKSFIKMYWMLLNNSNDKGKNAMRDAQTEFLKISTSDTKKVALYLKLADELQVGLSQEIKYNCQSCGREAHTGIRFPDGISNLFIPADISEELL